jgi:hypothetical protein
MMNWMLVDRPGLGKKTVPLTEHILDGLEKAATCVAWLKGSGYHVVDVSVGTRNPRVEIEYCQACEKLDGSMRIIESSLQGRRTGYFALRHGCEIRWERTQ